MILRFGTDGIRGVANQLLTPEAALRLGRAVAQILDDEPDAPILVGRDTRCSGPMLEGAFTAGVLSTGRDVQSIGIAPTPAIAMLTQRSRARAGIIISASHNPIEDNGFKIFDRSGMKLPDALERNIESAIEIDEAPRVTHAAVGTLTHVPELIAGYVDALIANQPSLEGLTVIVDAAYGAAWEIAPRALQTLGATVIPLHTEPDGTRINVRCGATDLRSLEQAVRTSALQGKEAIGIAFDGDADRVRFVDERGLAVEGDAVILALARDLHEAGVLEGAIVVGTVMSNLACEQELAKSGIRLIRTPVGDRHVLERLRSEGAIFGGEPSGHLIDLRRNVTGDGPATAIAMLSLLRRSNRKLSDIAQAYHPFPQELVNVRVHTAAGILTHPTVADASMKATKLLGDTGRLLIRPSGTEPLVRVMVEGQDAELVREIAAGLAETVRVAAQM